MTEMKFIADVMVGKLARWLRVLGFDVAYSNQYDDDEIIKRASNEKRPSFASSMSARARSTFIRMGIIQRSPTWMVILCRTRRVSPAIHSILVRHSVLIWLCARAVMDSTPPVPASG